MAVLVLAYTSRYVAQRKASSAWSVAAQHTTDLEQPEKFNA